MRIERMLFKLQFTLIELLVVVSIISILCAILLPVLSKAKEKVRQVACSSNLKQIGAGHMMYLEDYRGFFPYTNGTTVGDQEHFSDDRGIWRYLKSGNDWQRCPLYVCPSGISPLDTWASVGFTAAAGWNYGHKYGYGFLFNYRSYNVSRIKNGSGKAYLLDAMTPSTSYGEILANSSWRPAYRHSTGSNVMFFDFHVQWEGAAYIMNNQNSLLYPVD